MEGWDESNKKGTMSGKNAKLIRKVAKLFGNSDRQLRKFFKSLTAPQREQARYEYDDLLLEAKRRG